MVFAALLISTLVSASAFELSDMGGEEASTKLREMISVAIEDQSSKEFIIGVEGMPFESYASLIRLVETWGGVVTNNISLGGRMEAVVADLPSISVSPFLEEVMKAFEPNYLHLNEQFKIDFVPNDPFWTLQWGLAKIEVDIAWNTTVGDSSLLLAVVDTGVDWNHPDLAPNYAPLGYDWVNDDSNPMDDHGHGTHVAGIAAAVMNNSIGVTGISQVRIMAEKALNQTGYGFSDDLAEAIIHAADQNADIISMSWGSYSYNLLIQHAIRYAYNSGVLLVAAAGNNATSEKCYPAAYNEVIAVSATDRNDNLAYFSNYGEWIEFAAPGVSIYSTTWNDDYAYKSGTSMAAPHVSGVAALIWSAFPNMTRDQVRSRLQDTAEDLGSSGFDIYYGYGRINAGEAVQTDIQMHDISVDNVTIYKDIVHQGGSLPINVTVQNKCNHTETFNVTVNANTTLITTWNMSLAGGNSSTIDIMWNTTGIAKGNYIIKVVAEILPGETYSLDNNFTDGPITVVIAGDVTGRGGWPDGKCDMMDVGFVAKYYSQNVPPAPSYCDLTGSTPGVPDRKIDMRDLGIVAGHFGDIDL
jgi:hypothetical protein